MSIAVFLNLVNDSTRKPNGFQENAVQLAEASKLMLKQTGLKLYNPQGLAGLLHTLIENTRLINEYTNNIASGSQRTALEVALRNVITLTSRMTFGMRLKELRKNRGIRTSELAAQAGIDSGYISKLETFVAGPPSASFFVPCTVIHFCFLLFVLASLPNSIMTDQDPLFRCLILPRIKNLLMKMY